MKAYKLFRQLKNGDITSLFINKKRRLPINEWLEAEKFPTKGFAFRPYWHCTKNPIAPHLSAKGRVWCLVSMKGYKKMERPEHQGGTWYLAENIKILKIITDVKK